jgi:hypothetical protein
VLAKRRDSEQFFAVAGMKSGEREREEDFRS